MDVNTKIESFLLNILRNEFDETLEDADLSKHRTRPTLLHSAAIQGDLRLTKILINSGYEIDVVDNQGNTPLVLALIHRKLEIAHILLKANASVLITNKNGDNAVTISNRNIYKTSSFTTTAILKQLKKECDDASLLTAQKLLEFNCSLPSAVKLRDKTVIKYMLENNCNFNDRTIDYYKALKLAVAISDVEIFKFLINYASDNNVKINYNRLIDLLEVDKDDSIEIFKILLDKGASVFDASGKFLKSTFLYRGNEKFVKGLMQIGNLDLNQKNQDGKHLLDSLAGNFHFDPIEIIKGQNLDIITIRDNNHGFSAVSRAVYCANVQTVEYLLKNGALVNDICFGRIALFFAFYARNKIQCSLKCIESLLQHGANAQWKDGNNRTIFEIMTEFNVNPILIKPVLAHLFLIQALGSKIEDYILTNINSRIFYRKYFDSCKQKIAEMKKKLINHKVSLFDFLTVSEDKIIIFARNKKLVSRLELMTYSLRRSKVYYHKILRKRVPKLVQIANLRNKALEFLSHVKGLENNCIVISKIVNLFNFDDLLVIAKV